MMLVCVPLVIVACGGPPVRPSVAAGEAAADPLLVEGLRHLRAEGVPYDLARARSLFGEACGQGSRRGCAMLADALLRGPMDGQDFDRALSLSEAACEAGEPLGCTHAAWIMSGEVFTDEAREEQCATHAAVCTGGELIACVRQGQCIDISEDAEGEAARETVELYRRACNGGEGEGCNDLGMLYAAGWGVHEDAARALALYLRACARGAPEGCGNAGRILEEGRVDAPDPDRAALLYEQACERGAPWGCYHLATLHEKGLGVAHDDPRALALHEQACVGGARAGCTALAMRYQRGQGVPLDAAVAAEFLAQGCALGAADACISLAEQYLSGDGVVASHTEALGRYRDACDAGSPQGCLQAGYMLILGRGGPIDPVEALARFEVACASGEDDGCRARGGALSVSAWFAESEPDPAARRERVLELFRDGCELGHDSACLHRTVLEGGTIAGAREWEIEIIEATNAPNFIHVGDVCSMTVLTNQTVARLRVSCNGRLIYPPNSVIRWVSPDRVSDDETTRDNTDARLIVDGRAGTFLLEDDDAGFMPNIRLRGHVMPLHR